MIPESLNLNFSWNDFFQLEVRLTDIHTTVATVTQLPTWKEARSSFFSLKNAKELCSELVFLSKYIVIPGLNTEA